MDLRTLTKLVLKLLGLYFFVVAVTQALNVVMLDEVHWFFFLTVAMYLAIGVACFWFPGAVVNRILRIEGSELEGAVTANRLFGVGVALIGLYLAASATFALVFTLAGSTWFYRFTDAFGGAKGPDISPQQFASLVTYSVQLAVGVGLWLGWRWIAKFTGMGNDR